ncbi:MAG: glycoside hydrolase family 65 protein [Bacteroidales bacterium]|nr:glycoside hydrolase family 65 protein [Bacteroidales bacterium]
MNKYLKIDPWCIIEEGFDSKRHQSSESIFSIGNGLIGQRANFEEDYSGKSLQGTYVAGVYYPDKTKVGWWKNGYPEYFAKVLNATNFIGIRIFVNGDALDLAKCKVLSFQRVLNMKLGVLSRNFVVEMPSGKQVEVTTSRFLSMAVPETGAIHYSLSPVNADVEIKFVPYLDGNVINEDANWDEVFWDQVTHEINGKEGYIVSRTKKTEFEIACGMFIKAFLDGKEILQNPMNVARAGYVEAAFKVKVAKKSRLAVYKHVAVLSSLYHDRKVILDHTKQVLKKSGETGFEKLLMAHVAKWATIWEHSDIVIEGDDEAQQGIRFNIFHLNQTYRGDDPRLNIGPKGFTGEKYGGSTYWDTEAFCIPFFLCTAPASVTRNLLLYRYKHLGKAIENGRKLGFTGGAALYPMVTINGEECHNEWEITFEEIHRNGAIAFAIYNYVRHTGDHNYLIEYGLEVLIAISRFWSQRVNWSDEKKQYVMLGVTGPNEYENNVNNNWYTNTLASWTLQYTIETIELVKHVDPSKYKGLIKKIRFKEREESSCWKDIIAKMYYPYLESEGIFLQQEGYMDKEQMTTEQLDPAQRPLNQKWSWDRILRSCFIKQADVLQGIYLFEEKYDTETILRNFDFYETRTVHESSLSPCIHVVLAARLGKMELAHRLYLRTSRLDIDDYNNEVSEGLHITSMAGTYLAIIEGFAGKRVREGRLVLNPQIPASWKTFAFKILFRDSQLKVDISKKKVVITNESAISVEVNVYNNDYAVASRSTVEIKRNKNNMGYELNK